MGSIEPLRSPYTTDLELISCHSSCRLFADFAYRWAETQWAGTGSPHSQRTSHAQFHGYRKRNIPVQFRRASSGRELRVSHGIQVPGV